MVVFSGLGRLRERNSVSGPYVPRLAMGCSASEIADVLSIAGFAPKTRAMMSTMSRVSKTRRGTPGVMDTIEK